MSSPMQNQDDAVVLAITWTLSALCIVVVAARFAVVRLVARRGWGADDWIMLVAVAFQIIYESFVTISTEVKLRNLRSQVQDPDAVKYAALSSIPATFASITARISASILLIRLFGTKTWFKWYLIILTGTVAFIGILSIIFYMGRTDPVDAIWNPEEFQGYRWSKDAQTIPASILASLLAWSDLTYVLFPIIIIWKLQMPLRRKIGLAVILGISLFAMIAAILKALITLGLAALDLMFRPEDGLLWAGIEQTVVIIIGSIPPLVPVLKFHSPFTRWHGLLTGHFRATTKSSDQQTPNGNGSVRNATDGFGAKEIYPLREVGNKTASFGETDETVLTMVDDVGFYCHATCSQVDVESGSATTDCDQLPSFGTYHSIA